MPFQFHPQTIPDVILVEPRRAGDARGFFMETYKRSEFAAHGIDVTFVQDNFSHSACGVLRGLHYQKEPHAQGKLLMAAQGVIFDVAVDIRPESPTFAKWVGVTLSADKPCMFYIPPGFAHGFCVLSETADLMYKVSAEYSQTHETGILWNDPDIGVEWPVDKPILSARDAQLPLLSSLISSYRGSRATFLPG
jgi:dTDP-4-dehydrorhamnose 3,5-epimerase